MLMFYNDFFMQIRAIDVDGEPWFVAKDVACNLGFSDPKKAIRYHVDPDDRVEIDSTRGNLFPRIPDTIGRMQKTVWINEAGVNALILGRNNMKGKHLGADNNGPTIKEFRQWVMGEVLPTLRRYGRYGVISEDDLAKNVKELKDKLARYEANRAIDHDGFMRLLPNPDGRYYQFLKQRYRDKGYMDAMTEVLKRS